MPNAPTFRASMSRRTLLRHGVLLGGATLAAPALLAACGSSAAGDPTAARTPASPRRGGTLRMAASAPADAIDPTRSNDTLGMIRGLLVYERLGNVLPDGTVEGVLYDEFTPNDDATRWTLTLKEGIAFADGKPLTAEDVLQSFSAYEGTEAGAATALVDVASSTADDDLTATLALVSPVADLDYRLAKAYFLILPAGRTATTAEQLNGSGAYRVETFAPGQRSILVRRDDFWGGDGAWYPEQIELLSVPDPAGRMNALLAGQVDYADDVAYVDAAAQRTAR